MILVADYLYFVEHFGVEEGKFRPLTYEELKNLPMLDAVIRETLRVHPPIHSIIVSQPLLIALSKILT